MSRILRTLGIAATAAFFLSIYTPVWNYAGSLLAVPADIRKADAIVVLGAGMNADGSLGDESLRRAVYGMQLFKQGLGDVLVLSGPPRGTGSRSEADVRRDLAIQFGIPADRIQTIDRVATTHDEAQQVGAFLASQPRRTVLLVTGALHMRRAGRVFENAELGVFRAPSDDEPAARFSPSVRLELAQRILEQTGAIVYYRIAGYL